MSEPITLRIDAEPHNRIARIHEALRDLGLELCGNCNIWRGTEHMLQVGLGPFASTICKSCYTVQSGEAESVGGFRDALTVTPLAAAIRELAR